MQIKAKFMLTLLLAGTIAAQEHTFSSNVKVVNVLATVREKNGNIVRNLTKDDFQLSEDGRPQVIRYFAQETDLPLTLGLLVDTSISQQHVLVEERAASQTFLTNMLRAAGARKSSTQNAAVAPAQQEPDRAFIIQFDVEVEILQDITSSRPALESALDLLTIPSADRVWREPQARADTRDGQRMSTGKRSDRVGRLRHGGGTLLYDAVHLATDETMRPLIGRKALIVLSDGEDYGSKHNLDGAVESAQRADTVVYTILFTEETHSTRTMGPRPTGNGRRVLEHLAKATGGRAFRVTPQTSIRQVYAQIEEELRNQYNLGYSSDRPASAATEQNGGEKNDYRKISVTTRRKGVTIQARDGYYANRQAK